MSKCPIPHCLIPVVKYGPKIAVAAAGLFLASKLYAYTAAIRKSSAEKARHSKQQKGVVYLFAFPPHPTLGQLSAPCTKIETFLKLNKIKYETVHTFNTSISPTERLPMIELDGVVVADSTFAIKYLIDKLDLAEKEKVHAPKDASEVAAAAPELTLTPQQHAKGIALRRILEDSARLSLYRFTMVDNSDMMFTRLRAQLPTKLPSFVIKFLLGRTFRPRIINMLNLHGHGDLTDAQYHEEFLADIKAVEALIGESEKDNKFAVGTADPTSYDAAVYGWLFAMLAPDLPVEKCAALKYAAESAVFAAYKARIEAAMA